MLYSKPEDSPKTILSPAVAEQTANAGGASIAKGGSCIIDPRSTSETQAEKSPLIVWLARVTDPAAPEATLEALLLLTVTLPVTVTDPAALEATQEALLPLMV